MMRAIAFPFMVAALTLDSLGVLCRQTAMLVSALVQQPASAVVDVSADSAMQSTDVSAPAGKPRQPIGFHTTTVSA